MCGGHGRLGHVPVIGHDFHVLGVGLGDDPLPDVLTPRILGTRLEVAREDFRAERLEPLGGPVELIRAIQGERKPCVSVDAVRREPRRQRALSHRAARLPGDPIVTWSDGRDFTAIFMTLVSSPELGERFMDDLSGPANRGPPQSAIPSTSRPEIGGSALRSRLVALGRRPELGGQAGRRPPAGRGLDPGEGVAMLPRCGSSAELLARSAPVARGVPPKLSPDLASRSYPPTEPILGGVDADSAQLSQTPAT
jgi:hypothetical protein